MNDRIAAEVIRRRLYAEVSFDVSGGCLWLTEEGESRVAQVWKDYRDGLVHAGRRVKGLYLRRGRSSGTFRVLAEDAEAIRRQVERILNDPECLHIPAHLREAMEKMAEVRKRRRACQDGGPRGDAPLSVTARDDLSGLIRRP